MPPQSSTLSLKIMIKLKLIPSYLNEFTVNKSPGQIIAEIGAITERKKRIRLKKTSKKFEGEIGNTWFKLKKIVYTSGNMLPQIRGNLIGNNFETKVVINAKPDDYLITISYILLCSIVILSIIASIVDNLIFALVFLLIMSGSIFGIIWLCWLAGIESINLIENIIKK